MTTPFFLRPTLFERVVNEILTFSKIGVTYGFWAPTTFAEWYNASPLSFNDEGIELCSESIFYLPLISDKNIPKLYKPSYRLLSQPSIGIFLIKNSPLI